MSKKKNGRPRKEIDFEILKKLCAIQCTEEEICFFFEVSKDTIQARLKEKYNLTFPQFFKKYSVEGKISLRRSQFHLAKKSPAMAIWLGKQYLGQREPTMTVATEDDEKLLKKVAEIMEKGV